MVSLEPGTLIWAKIPCTPWWPGRIADVSDVACIPFPERKLKNTQVFVAFFGETTVDKVPIKNLKPIDCAEYGTYANNKKALQKAFFKEALEELKDKVKEAGVALPFLHEKAQLTQPSTADRMATTVGRKRQSTTSITAIMESSQKNSAKKAKIAGNTPNLPTPMTKAAQKKKKNGQRKSFTSQNTDVHTNNNDNHTSAEAVCAVHVRHSGATTQSQSAQTSQTTATTTEHALAGDTNAQETHVDKNKNNEMNKHEHNEMKKHNETHIHTCTGDDRGSDSDSDSDSDLELRSSGLCRRKDNKDEQRVVHSVVWAKMGRWPHWPSVVLSVKRDRRLKQKKFVIRFINYKPLGKDGRPVVEHKAFTVPGNNCIHFNYNDDKVKEQLQLSRAGLYPNHFAYDADLVEATRDAQQWLRNRAHGLLKTPHSTITTPPTHTTHKTDDASADDEIVSVDESRVTLTTSRQTLTLTTVCATAAEITEDIMANGRQRRITTKAAPSTAHAQSTSARSSGVGGCIVSDSDSDSDSVSDMGFTCGDEIDCDVWEEEERVREEANERKLLQRYPQLTPYTEGLPDDLLRVKSDIVAIDSGRATSLRKQWYDKGFSRDQNKYNQLHLYGPFVRQSDQELIRTTVASWSSRNALMRTDVTAGMFIQHVLVVEAVLRIIANKENITTEEAYAKCNRDGFMPLQDMDDSDDD